MREKDGSWSAPTGQLRQWTQRDTTINSFLFQLPQVPSLPWHQPQKPAIGHSLWSSLGFWASYSKEKLNLFIELNWWGSTRCPWYASDLLDVDGRAAPARSRKNSMPAGSFLFLLIRGGPHHAPGWPSRGWAFWAELLPPLISLWCAGDSRNSLLQIELTTVFRQTEAGIHQISEWHQEQPESGENWFMPFSIKGTDPLFSSTDRAWTPIIITSLVTEANTD